MADLSRVALITGGSRGIGAATARMLSAKGVRVVINYAHQVEPATQLVTELQKYTEAIAIQADVRDPEQVATLVDETMRAFSRIDIVVSNAPAGFFRKSFAQLTWHELSELVNAELKGAYEISQAVFPIMVKQHYGRIIYTASAAGLRPVSSVPGASAVGVAKGTLLTLAKYLAIEYAPYGITVNTVAPGIVETEAALKLPVEFRENIAAQTPIGRNAKPEDIANAIAFYADEASGFVTGNLALVTGGILID